MNKNLRLDIRTKVYKINVIFLYEANMKVIVGRILGSIFTHNTFLSTAVTKKKLRKKISKKKTFLQKRVQDINDFIIPVTLENQK